ncbi:hypothetical protein [Noviluteimonas gilva]|uniref:Uncharacterized protein n=1 Tax=Noviluteimonas gilva TaxID=2682097 RepID=A0A7C9M4N1_9GAMM|nr:hypothetical protein [Lysobacter gilvus]MUV15146.1 hypothetical protein [Lysobacter gilvus]
MFEIALSDEDDARILASQRVMFDTIANKIERSEPLDLDERMTAVRILRPLSDNLPERLGQLRPGRPVTAHQNEAACAYAVFRHLGEDHASAVTATIEKLDQEDDQSKASSIRRAIRRYRRAILRLIPPAQIEEGDE